jgi:hypothetical protein
MLFTSLFTMYLIVNVILLRNLPNRIVNTISVQFFNSLTYYTSYPVGTVFYSFIVIFTIFADFHNDSFTFPVFVDGCTYSHIYPPSICSLSVSFESYSYFIWLIWYRMSIVISSQDLETKSTLNWSFEIKNGLLGVKRDRFVSLIGTLHFDEKNNKIRNVWINYFFLFIFFFFFFYYFHLV